MNFMSNEIRTLQLEFWDYSNRRLGVLAMKELEKYLEGGATRWIS